MSELELVQPCGARVANGELVQYCPDDECPRYGERLFACPRFGHPVCPNTCEKHCEHPEHWKKKEP